MTYWARTRKLHYFSSPMWPTEGCVKGGAAMCGQFLEMTAAPSAFPDPEELKYCMYMFIQDKCWIHHGSRSDVACSTTGFEIPDVMLCACLCA